MAGRPEFNPVRDVISGIIMAATSVPQLVAYAETTGYASYRGLATAGPSLFAWGLSTGSPFMSCGVTSITALMAKTDLDGDSYVAEHGEAEYARIVAAYSLYIGLASILLAVVGFGKLAQSVPKNVRSGFKWGCAVGVVASAVPNGLFAGGSRQLKAAVAKSAVSGLVKSVKENLPMCTGFVNVTNLIYALVNPFNWSVIPAVLFLLSTVFVMKAGKYLPKSCPPGTEVIICCAVATLFSMKTDYPGGVVGEIPSLDADAGFDVFGIIKVPVEVLDYKYLMDAPIVEKFGSVATLMLSASLFAAVNFLSIMGIASGFEAENGIAWSAPRELVAQGIACIAAAFTGSAPVSGSMSRSLVSRMAGTTSQLSCLVTALVWIYLLPYMSIMSPTPKACLSAVIVSAVIKSVVYPKDLMNFKGTDLIVGWGTGIATCLTSPTIGFGVGLIMAIVLGFVSGSGKDGKKKTA
mmetsp:Transcript_16312/g.35420  ORF Transcript_16312/g.35420 Transcript_16312/m.35420 type:complete len:465 (+) Transcript_16312:63-1457(+)